MLGYCLSYVLHCEQMEQVVSMKCNLMVSCKCTEKSAVSERLV